MSRRGYMFLEESLMKENLEVLKEATNSYPLVVVDIPTRPTHHRKWKEGRKKKEKYLNKDITSAVKKIVSTYNFKQYGSLHNI